MVLLNVYVPYNPNHWQHWARSVLTSIGSASGLGFIVFTTLFCISIFHVVFRKFF